MALIPIRVDRTSKPPLGTPLRSDGHWSVQGLVGAWAFNEGTGSVAIGSKGASGAVSPLIKWIPSGLDFPGDTNGRYVSLDQEVFKIGPKLSLITSVVRRTYNTNYEGIFLSISTGAPYGGFGLWSMGNGVIRGSVDDDYNNDVKTTVAIPNGKRVTLSLICNGTSYSVWVDGKKASADKAIVTYTPSAIGRVARFGQSLHFAEIFDGIIEFGYLYTCFLLPEQIASLSANPWQIYEPETVWIEVGGGGEAALFAGSIYGQSSASALLSTAIRMAASAQGHGASTADLNTTIVLAAAAQGNATAQAALSTALELAAQVNGNGSATGALGADISGLAGSLHGSSEAQATLSTAIHLMGLAAGQCGVVGRLAEPVEILAQLRVMASDPLALTISVRDPLALRVTVH